MAVIEEVQILATPEVLKQKAADVTAQIEEISTAFSNIEQIIGRTAGYWEGEAADSHRKMYKDQKENINTMLRRLREHPTDLLQISGNYDAAEQTATDVTNILRVDAIS